MTQKKLIENSVLYSGLQILQKGAGFLLLPLYTRFLTPNDYGIISVITSTVSFLSVFYLFGLNGAANRFYVDFKDDKQSLKTFWGTIVTLLLIISTVFTTLLFCYKKYFIFVLGGIDFFPYMFLGIVSVAFSPIFGVYQSLLQAMQDGRKYTFVNFSNFLVLVSLTIIFIVFLEMKAIGPLLASAITSCVFCIYTFFSIRKEITFGINLAHLKKCLLYCVPIVPHNLTGWSSSLLDRILINNFVSTAMTGIYNIGCQLGNLQLILSTAVTQAYLPWFFGELKHNRTDKVKKFFILAMAFYVTFALWVSLFSKDIISLMTTKAFSDAWKVVGLISFGNVFNGYYYFIVSPLFFFEKRIRYVPIATVSGALFGFCLNLILIPKYGIMGAAFTMFFTSIVSVLLVGWFAHNYQPIDWDHFTVIMIIIINGTVCIVDYGLVSSGIVTSINILIFKIIAASGCTFLNYRFCLGKTGRLNFFNFGG
jgi:O-antigen/teichoic acid export membrane protein